MQPGRHSRSFVQELSGACSKMWGSSWSLQSQRLPVLDAWLKVLSAELCPCSHPATPCFRLSGWGLRIWKWRFEDIPGWAGNQTETRKFGSGINWCARERFGRFAFSYWDQCDGCRSYQLFQFFWPMQTFYCRSQHCCECCSQVVLGWNGFDSSHGCCLNENLHRSRCLHACLQGCLIFARLLSSRCLKLPTHLS